MKTYWKASFGSQLVAKIVKCLYENYKEPALKWKYFRVEESLLNDDWKTEKKNIQRCKVKNNGRESAVNRELDGSTYAS